MFRFLVTYLMGSIVFQICLLVFFCWLICVEWQWNMHQMKAYNITNFLSVYVFFSVAKNHVMALWTLITYQTFLLGFHLYFLLWVSVLLNIFFPIILWFLLIPSRRARMKMPTQKIYEIKYKIEPFDYDGLQFSLALTLGIQSKKHTKINMKIIWENH